MDIMTEMDKAKQFALAMLKCKEDFVGTACIPESNMIAPLVFSNEEDKQGQLIMLGKIVKEKNASGCITILDSWYSKDDDNILPLEKPMDDRLSAISIMWHDLKNNGLNNKMLMIKYNSKKEILGEEVCIHMTGNANEYIKCGYNLQFKLKKSKGSER